MILNKQLSTELNGLLSTIKFVPDTKEDMVKNLSENLDSKTLEGLFNGKITADSLGEVELFHVLKEVYRVSKDERFNPAVLLEQETSATNNDSEDDYIIVNGKRKKKGKDDIPRYYYDYDFKKKFASNYPHSTSRVIMALFRNTKKKEVEFGKDLCDFNLDELKDVLKSFKTTTIRSLQNQVSTIERYISFAQKDKEKDTLYNKINFASELDSKDKISDLLDKDAEDNMIFDKDEIMEMASYADNAQDGVILGLLFDGVSHKNEFEELTNLSDENVDFDNQEIKLQDRIVPMSHETMTLVKEALDQDRKYLSITGETSRQYKVAEGNRVLRGLRGKNKVKGQIVSQRILRIAEANGYEYLNATTIAYSGQLHYAKTLVESGYTVEDAIPKVLERFGFPNNTSSQFYLRSRIERFLSV